MLRPEQSGGPQLPDPGRQPHGAGATARRILSGPEYHHRGTDRSLIQRVEDWIKRHLPHIHAGTAPKTPSSVSVVIVVVLAVALVAVVVWAIVAVRRGRRSDPGDLDEAGGEGEVEITPLRSTDQWRVEAERLEAAGHWREALRARYRSVIGLLIDRKLLADLPGRTPGEHRVELADAVPTAAPSFDAATQLFEASWYGHEVTAEADVERFRELADAVSAETVGAQR